MLIRRAPRFASNDITDEKHYLSRREWMIGAAALTLLPGESPAAPQGQPLTATQNEAQSLKEPPTKSGSAPVAGGACTGSRTSPGGGVRPLPLAREGRTERPVLVRGHTRPTARDPALGRRPPDRPENSRTASRHCRRGGNPDHVTGPAKLGFS